MNCTTLSKLTVPNMLRPVVQIMRISKVLCTPRDCILPKAIHEPISRKAYNSANNSMQSLYHCSKCNFLS